MANSKCLNEKLIWALSPQAREALKELEDKGMDRDLAITLLESLVSEDKLYDLPKDESDGIE